MKKPANIFALCFFVLIVAGDVVYMLTSSLLVKSITSALFVLLGLFGLCYALAKNVTNKRYCLVMFLGLVFAMTGDIVLEVQFIVGAILFAVGHIFFFVAYCTLIGFKWTDLLYGVCLFVPVTLFMTLTPIFNFGGVTMLLLCLAYALIISAMVGKSIANFVRIKSQLNLLIMLGSILFTFSDFMLLLNVFAGLPVVGILCLLSYYPAEFLLAYSILRKGINKEERS